MDSLLGPDPVVEASKLHAGLQALRIGSQSEGAQALRIDSQSEGVQAALASRLALLRTSTSLSTPPATCNLQRQTSHRPATCDNFAGSLPNHQAGSLPNHQAGSEQLAATTAGKSSLMSSFAQVPCSPGALSPSEYTSAPGVDLRVAALMTGIRSLPVNRPTSTPRVPAVATSASVEEHIISAPTVGSRSSSSSSSSSSSQSNAAPRSDSGSICFADDEAPVWHEVKASIMTDQVTGGPALLLTQSDVTAKVTADLCMSHLACTQVGWCGCGFKP